MGEGRFVDLVRFARVVEQVAPYLRIWLEDAKGRAITAPLTVAAHEPKYVRWPLSDIRDPPSAGALYTGTFFRLRADVPRRVAPTTVAEWDSNRGDVEIYLFGSSLLEVLEGEEIERTVPARAWIEDHAGYRLSEVTEFQVGVHRQRGIGTIYYSAVQEPVLVLCTELGDGSWLFFEVPGIPGGLRPKRPLMASCIPGITIACRTRDYSMPPHWPVPLSDQPTDVLVGNFVVLRQLLNMYEGEEKLRIRALHDLTAEVLRGRRGSFGGGSSPAP